jgi:hypothetical protein
VVRRARRRADQAQLLVQELHHPLRVQQRLRLLVEVRLVGRAAALGHEEELVGVRLTARVLGVELDLGRQVGAGVALVPHGERRELGVAQVQPGVRLVHTLGDGLLVGAVGEHVPAALAHHDRRAGVLAHRQHAAGRDVRVA